MAGYNMDFDSIGRAFVAHYYGVFDSGDPTARAAGLAPLYDAENSYMTFEGAQVKGRDAIIQKFSALTFKDLKRAFTTTDCQPMPAGLILVKVLGQLKTDEDPPQSFVHTFILAPNAGSFFISNEMFRLVLHNV